MSPGKNRGSHTVRSGQASHTPGGTKGVLWVGGESRKTAGPTLPGAARRRTLQEGTNYVLRVNVKPRKSFTVNGTVPLKPLFKGQVGCVRAFV